MRLADLFRVITATLTVSACASRTDAAVVSAGTKAAVTDSTKAVIESMMSAVNHMDFKGYFGLMSADADARYVQNGELYPSRDAMEKAFAGLTSLVDSIGVAPDREDVVVLAPDAAAVTLPFHIVIKPKGRAPVTGQGLWTGIVQRRGGRWLIVQRHESWANADAMMAGILPPPATPTKK